MKATPIAAIFNSSDRRNATRQWVLYEHELVPRHYKLTLWQLRLRVNEIAHKISNHINQPVSVDFL